MLPKFILVPPPNAVHQATTKTLAQQQEQLKKIETFSALQETNKMLKMDRDKLEQDLQQAQARVSVILNDQSEQLQGHLVQFCLPEVLYGLNSEEKIVDLFYLLNFLTPGCQHFCSMKLHNLIRQH